MTTSVSTDAAITAHSSLPKGAAWAKAIDDMPARAITLEVKEFERCKRNCEAGGFKGVTRFEAIRGADFKQSFANDRTKLTLRALYEIEHAGTREAHSSMPSWGGVGCYLSHVALWREAMASPNGIFVFEGDAVPGKATFAKVKKALMQLREKGVGVDQYVFGHFGAVASKVGGVPDVRLATGRLYGLTAYYISPQGAHRLLKNAFPIEVQVDSYTGYAIEEEGVQIYYSSHILVPQVNIGGTKIQTKHVKDALINSGAHINAMGLSGEQTGMIVVIVFLLMVIAGFGILYWHQKRTQRQ